MPIGPETSGEASATASDGSPVPLYARLAPLGEPELVHAAIPAGATILELGCGAGRLTHSLLALGHPVVAVEESPEMLAHVQGAEKVLADVTRLDLGRRFPVVLLASNFLNLPDPRERGGFLAACARHLQPDGAVLVQGHGPDWDPVEGETEVSGIVMRLRDLRRDGRLVSAVMEYEVDGARLTHPFTSAILSGEQIEASLAAAGLRLERYLDEQRAWLVARAA